MRPPPEVQPFTGTRSVSLHNPCTLHAACLAALLPALPCLPPCSRHSLGALPLTSLTSLTSSASPPLRSLLLAAPPCSHHLPKIPSDSAPQQLFDWTAARSAVNSRRPSSSITSSSTSSTSSSSTRPSSSSTPSRWRWVGSSSTAQSTSTSPQSPRSHRSPCWGTRCRRRRRDTWRRRRRRRRRLLTSTSTPNTSSMPTIPAVATTLAPRLLAATRGWVESTPLRKPTTLGAPRKTVVAPLTRGS